MKLNCINIFIIATLISVLFCSCSKSEPNSIQISEKKGKIVIEIHNFLYNEAIVKAINTVKSMKKYSDFDFEVAIKDEEYETTLPIKIAAGIQVDILAIFNPIQQVNFADAGVIIPLDEYAEKSGVNYNYEFGPFSDASLYKGKHIMLPMNTTRWVLFYNKKIFDDAGIAYPDPDIPMTWSEYRALAARLTRGSGEGKIYGALHMYWPMFWYGEAIMELGGGEYFYTADGKSNIEHPAFRRALQATYNMQHVDKSIPTHSDLVIYKIPPQGFFDGKYGMFAEGAWMLNWAMDKENYPRDWEMGICHLPVDSGTTPKTWGVAGGLAVSPTAADPQLAFDIAMEMVRFSAEYATTEAIAIQTVPQSNLYVGAGEVLGAEGLTAEVLQKYFLPKEQIFITEKVTGPNNAVYDQVIAEEVEKYFVKEQDLDTTIANIKKRGDDVIAGD